MSWGLYVHVPFCLGKCAYCDFVSYPFVQAEAGRYLWALRREMELCPATGELPLTAPDTVFIGGGTPTIMPGKCLADLIRDLAARFRWPESAEVTIEANPGTIDRLKLAGLRTAGVNRLSIGMQAAYPQTLATLGRRHTYADVIESVQAARDTGFTNLNLDLIFGVPGQTLDEWRATIALACSLEPEHIAAYSLEIPEGTRLFQLVERSELEPCPEETELEMYQLLRQNLARHGYRQYEISNFARPGHKCRHNLRYWHNGNYLGLGPAAHSHFNGHRWSNHSEIERYVTALDAGEFPLAEDEQLDRRTQMAETMFMGLRLKWGVNLLAFRERFGVNTSELYSGEIDRLLRLGLIEIADDHLRLTEVGLPVANIVFAEFL